MGGPRVPGSLQPDSIPAVPTPLPVAPSAGAATGGSVLALSGSWFAEYPVSYAVQLPVLSAGILVGRVNRGVEVKAVLDLDLCR